MPLGTDVFGSLSNSVEQIVGALTSPIELLNFVPIVLGWLIARAVTAIFGEYAKRLWFRRLWKDEVTRCREQLEQLKVSIATERAEYQWAIASTERLLVENDHLLLRLIQAEARLSEADHDEPV